MGQTFFPKSDLGDFGEYYVALSVAESWARYIMSTYRVEVEEPEQMIIQTPRLGNLISMLLMFASANPVAMDNRHRQIRNN